MKKVLGRLLVMIPALTLQFWWYWTSLGWLNGLLNGKLSTVINYLFTVMAVLFVIYLISKRDESSYKILWIVVIMAMPILGAYLYLTMGNRKTGRRFARRLSEAAKVFPEDFGRSELFDELEEHDRRFGQTVRQLGEVTGFPLLHTGETEYFRFGEDMFRAMCEDLKRAEKYIFVEYFIIQRGKFWDTLTEIMEERAAHGVDVRVIYDDFGSIKTYSPADIRRTAAKGIKYTIFNPFLFIKGELNNRDHRKLMVIDGKVAYSGGVNLADEYINEVQRFGVWKDIGFRLTGEGVRSYAFMFAEFWNAFSFEKIGEEDIKREAESLAHSGPAGNGYVIPYYDSPVNEQHASNELYVELLSLSSDYIWFFTPYLMLGDELFNAMIRAARRGVDVRIIMPGIPDKKLVYRLSRSYYGDLVDAGVKIYEYTPGFVHAKAVVCDDAVAAIGTVNLDYRSLFLHFECNALFYKSDIIRELKNDFEMTQKECVLRDAGTINRRPLHNLIDGILRIAAPLM